MTGKIQFAILISLVYILIFAGCGDKRNRSVQRIEKTPSEKQKAQLLKKIDRNFDDAQAHYELGQLYQADGLWTQAEYEYNTALSFDPVHRESQAAMVNTLLQNGNNQKARLCADIYSSQAATSPLGSLRLALAFQKQQLDEYALGCYQQALRLAPNSAKINRQVGYYYLAKGDKARAQDYLTRSFNLDRNQPEVAMQLGKLGVVIQRPQKQQKATRGLDRVVEQSDKDLLK